MFKLKANPTFWATVSIPVAGEDSRPLEVEFVHRRKTELKAFGESLAGRMDDDVVPEIVKDWRGADAEFTPGNLAELLEEHAGAAAALINAYFREHTAASRKN